jgi:hypothetical protein
MEPHRHLEPVYVDNVAKEDKLLAQHPDWTLKRLRPEGAKSPAQVTYEASNGAVTVTSDDLGLVLKLMERAIQEGESS